MHIDYSLVAQGDLAESWSVSPDGLNYTIKLKEGVKFHNGDRFNADDVLFTFNRSKDPEQSNHSRVIANVNELEKLNDYEVKFTLNKPQASFLTKALERASGRAVTIVSQGALDSMGLAKYGMEPVGTGPCKIVEHKQGRSVVLERFADYYDSGRLKLDEITKTPVDGAEPLAAALEAGDVQYVGGNPIPSQLIDRFKSNSDLKVDIKPAPGFQSIWLNPWRGYMRVDNFDKPLGELKKKRISGPLGNRQSFRPGPFSSNKPSLETVILPTVRSTPQWVFISMKIWRMFQSKPTTPRAHASFWHKQGTQEEKAFQRLNCKQHLTQNGMDLSSLIS